MRIFPTLSMACGLALLVLAGCDADADTAAGGGDPAGDGGGDVTSTGGAGATGEGGAGEGGSGQGGTGDGGGASEPTRRGTLGVGRGVLAGQTQEAWGWGYVFGSFLAEPETAPPSCEVTTVGSCSVTDCLRDPAGEPGEGEGPTAFVSAGAVTVEGLSTPVTVVPTENGDYWLDLEGDHTSADEPFTAGAPVRLLVAGDVVPGFEVDLSAPARLTFTSPVLDDDLLVLRDEELQLTWDHGPGAGRVAAILEVEEPAGDGASVRVVTATCDADVVDGAVAMPAEVLGALPVTESAFLLVVAREETEVVAGDWRVNASVADFTMLYESVEIR